MFFPLGILTLLKHPYPRDVQEPVSYETIRVHAEWGNRPNADVDKRKSNTNLSVGTDALKSLWL